MSKDVKHLEFQLLHNLRQLQVTERGEEGRGRGREEEREGEERGRGERVGRISLIIYIAPCKTCLLCFRPCVFTLVRPCLHVSASLFVCCGQSPITFEFS